MHSASARNSHLVIHTVRPWCFLQNRLQSWRRKVRKCHRSAALRGGGGNPPTLEAAIDEMLGPLHLLRSHLLNHVQILKCGGTNTDSRDPDGSTVWDARCSPAAAEFLRQWDHLSSEPERVSLGLLGEDEVPDASRRCTGSLPTVQGWNTLPNIPESHKSWKFRKTNVYGLTDWDRVMPSISTAGTCCIGFNVLYCSVS